MPTLDNAMLAAHKAGIDVLRARARSEFPGITDLFVRDVNIGGDGAVETRLIGEWNGVFLGFTDDALGFFIQPYALCQCCGMYTHVGHGAESIAQLAARNTSDPPVAVSHCFACEWVLEAHREAVAATTRWKRWRFRMRRGTTPERVVERYAALLDP